LNLLQKLRIELVCFLRNSAGKKGIFFAQGVGAIKYTELLEEDIDVKGVDILFMTLQIDGLISLRYLIRSGFGL